LFYLTVKDICSLPNIYQCCVASTSPAPSLVTWHQRTHLSDDLLIKLSKGFAEGIKIEDEFLIHNLSICEDCGLSKPEKNSRKRKGKRKIAKFNLEQVDSDVKVVNVKGFKDEIYILSFRCARSKFTWLYFMKNKNDTREALLHFKINVIQQLKPENSVEFVLRRVHTDGGGEFFGQFEQLCKELSLRHTLSPPYCPELNNYAESYWRILMQTTRAFLSHAKLPIRLWTYACSYANYILNRTLLRPIEHTLKTSYEWLMGEKPDLCNIRTWGTQVYSFIPEQTRGNKSLSNRGLLGYFVGFADNFVHSVNLYTPEGQISPHKLEDVLFNEIIVPRVHIDTGEEVPHLPHIIIEPSSSLTTEGEESSTQLRSQSENQIQSQDKRKKRNSENESSGPRTSKRLRGKHVNVYTDRRSFIYSASSMKESARLLSESELRILKHAEQDPLTPEKILEWIQAIEKEKISIKINDVFQIVKKPYNRKILRTMWVLTKKFDELGNEIAKKARNVLLGNHTTEGIDYYETYAPVAKLSSLRMFLAVVTQFRMDMIQGDVNTAFLNAEIEEEIFLEIPAFFRWNEFLESLGDNDPLKRELPEDLCLKLKKSQYGLKQSSRNWYITFNDFLISIGFIPCSSEPCVYTYQDQFCRALFFLYVDDFILASTSHEFKDFVMKQISNRFKIKILGFPRTILGISIVKEGDHLFLHQKQKIEQLACDYNLEAAKPVFTPLDADRRLQKIMHSNKDKNSVYSGENPNNKSKQLETEYRSIVGRLNHIAQATRPDIAFSVAQLSKYLNNPTISHLFAAKRVIKYLFSTRHWCIVYRRDENSPLEFIVYSDSDWAGDPDTRRSQSGTLLILAFGPVHWSSTIQHLVALSSPEAETIALKQTVKDTLWLKNILQEMYRVQDKPIKVYEDKSSTIRIVTNPMISKKNRHMEIAYHFIIQHIEIGTISVMKVEGERNYADIFTKYFRVHPHTMFLQDLMEYKTFKSDFGKEEGTLKKQGYSNFSKHSSHESTNTYIDRYVLKGAAERMEHQTTQTGGKKMQLKGKFQGHKI